MATLFITEFSRQGIDGNNSAVPCAAAPALANQAVTISATSAQSAAFNDETALVRLQTDTACWVLFGTNPTATASMMPLAVNTPEYFAVPPNTSMKVAGITA